MYDITVHKDAGFAWFFCIMMAEYEWNVMISVKEKIILTGVHRLNDSNFNKGPSQISPDM